MPTAINPKEGGPKNIARRNPPKNNSVTTSVLTAHTVCAKKLAAPFHYSGRPAGFGNLFRRNDHSCLAVVQSVIHQYSDPTTIRVSQVCTQVVRSFSDVDRVSRGGFTRMEPVTGIGSSRLAMPAKSAARSVHELAMQGLRWVALRRQQ